MTVQNENLRNEYAATVGQTTFPYTFRLLDQVDITVYVDGVLQTLTTHYTVSNVDNINGGNVVFVAGLVAGAKVVLLLDPEFTQKTAYPFNDVFPETAHEAALDKLTMMCLRLKEILGRCLKFADFSTFDNITVPDLIAGKIMRINPSATGFELVDIPGAALALGAGRGVTVGSGVTSVPVAFSATAPDANYNVYITPDFNTTAYVTNKTTVGFTVRFGTASGGKFDWKAES
jgi:hypothetical protein